MKYYIFLLGRFLQIIALVSLPSAIWMAEFYKSEKGSLTIFLGSIALFYLGYLLARLGKR